MEMLLRSAYTRLSHVRQTMINDKKHSITMCNPVTYRSLVCLVICASMSTYVLLVPGRNRLNAYVCMHTAEGRP